MGFRPIGDRITVRRDVLPETSAGGIILTGSAVKQKANEGVVVAVGPGRYLPNDEFQATTVQPGDRVVFLEQSGHDIVVDGEVLTILNEGDIVAIIGE